MPTYSERMALGTAAAIKAGVDPRVAPFVASQYAPAEVTAPGVWSRPVADTPNIVQGIKNTASSIFTGIDQSLRESSFNPIAAGRAFRQTVGPAIMGIPTEVARAFETPREAEQRRAAQPKPPASTPAAAPGTLGGRSQAVQSQNVFDIQGMVGWARAQGAPITSVKRDPKHNAAVGGVTDSYHLTGQAFDSTPPKGMSMAAWGARLKAQFGGVADIINEGDHIHVEPRSRSQASGGGGMPGFVNPFDPTYHNMALGEINKGAQAALQPQTIAFDQGIAPKVPDPILPAKTDWSASDAALAKLEPAVLDEKQLLREKRANFFQGLASALASIPDGAGLGKVLGNLGAGALAGAAAGNRAVQERLDQFDEKMARYNLAVYNQETQKAQQIAEEARYEAGLLNTHGMQQWKADYEQWAANSQPMITSQGVTVKQVGADGKGTATFTPWRGPILAEAAFKRAGVFESAAAHAQSAANLQAQAINGLIGTQAGLLMREESERRTQASQGGAVESAMMTAAFQAGNIVDGGIAPSLLGPDRWKAATQEAAQLAGQMYEPGSSAYNEQVRSNLVTAIAQKAMGPDANFRKEFIQATEQGMQFYAAEKFRDRKARTSIDGKGRVSTSVTE